MLDPDLKKLLAILDWETNQKFKSIRSGGFFHLTKGRGLEFKEVRPYYFGDDTRYIDWNVTSRTGEVHVKEYYEEQDLPIMILIDVSKSMDGKKKKAAIQLACFLSLFHVRIGNRVRIILFSDHVYHSGKELKRKEEVNLEFKSILKKSNEQSSKKTNYDQAIEKAYRISSKYSIVYWLSDFTYFQGFESKKALSRTWDEYAIWIEEQSFEIQLPFWFRIFSLSDSETGDSLSFHSNLKQDQMNFKKTFGNKGITVRPEEKLSKQILGLFKGIRV